MSKYTLVNIISNDYDLQDLRSLVDMYNSQISLINNGCFARYGGDIREELKSKFVGDRNGKLIYNLKYAEKGSEGYLLLDSFEDTSNSHKTKFYTFKAFEGNSLIDEREFTSDSDGSKVEEYYKDEHNKYKFSKS